MYSHLRLVLFLFLCSNRHFVVDSEEECFPVLRCSDDQTLGIGKLAYNVDGNVTICPRSDPDVPSWEFLFTVNLNTSFCSADQFDRSVVCYETNSLKFSNLTGFHNQIGSIIFLDTTFGLNVTVLYGPVGVHPVNNLVFFKYNQTRVEMRWLVYYINNRPTIEVFFEDQMIARDGDAINCTQCAPSVDVTTCARSQAQETTTQYSIFLFNPTASFEGEYVLVADSSSATITLIIDPSSIPEPPKDISSSSSEVPEPTSTMDMSTPTPLKNSVDYSTIIIIIAVLVVLVIVISVSLGVAGIVWKVKKSRRTGQGLNLHLQNPIYPGAVDRSEPTGMTNDLSSSLTNQNPPQTEPSDNQAVLTNGNHHTLGQAESLNVTDSVSADPHHASQVSNQVEAVDSGQPIDETNTNNLPPTLTDQSLTQVRNSENPNVVSNDNVAQAVGRVADVLVDIREKLSKQHHVENDQRGKMIDSLNRIHDVESNQLEVQEGMAGQLETALVKDENTNTQDEPADAATVCSPENMELSITDNVETDEQVHVMGNNDLNEPAQLQLYDVENVWSDQPCDSSSSSDELDSGILERSPFAEESPPKPDTSNTQGAYNKIPFDEKGLFCRLNEYGATIIIPEGAVQGPATLQFEASMTLTDFRSDVPCEPVSPFIWLHTDSALTKPAELDIPHFTVADTDEDKMNLCLITRGHEQDAAFKVNNILEVQTFTTFVKIRATHFCTVCLASTSKPKKRYLLVYATKEQPNGALHVDISVLYSHYCLQVFRKGYEGHNIFRVRAPFTSGDVRMDVTLPENSDWEFEHREFEYQVIKERQIDFYQVLDCHPDAVTEEARKSLKYDEENGLYPPRFKLSFIPIHFPTKKCRGKINITGDNGEKISIPIKLGESASSLNTSSSSLDSASSNAISSGSRMLSEEPNYRQFMEFVGHEIIDNWERFGAMVGLTLGELEVIRNECQDVPFRFGHVLDKWKKSYYKKIPFTWESVASVLHSMGIHSVADEVVKAFNDSQKPKPN